MPHDPNLAERMRAALRGRKGITEKKMFGGYCWMLDGKMLCGVEVGRYMFRVGADREAKALAKKGVTPMDITGKPMRGFIWVDERSARGAALMQWIEVASLYVARLESKRT